MTALWAPWRAARYKKPGTSNDWRQGAVSFWECAMLHARRRLVLPQSPRAWRSELLAAGLIELPIDGEIAVLATELDDLHKDPADRFIAATAIKHQATLLTADARLLRWRHPLERRDATK
jgi:PIN domain nuclease of toxin-antitoxin system